MCAVFKEATGSSQNNFIICRNTNNTNEKHKDNTKNRQWEAAMRLNGHRVIRPPLNMYSQDNGDACEGQLTSE